MKHSKQCLCDVDCSQECNHESKDVTTFTELELLRVVEGLQLSPMEEFMRHVLIGTAAYVQALTGCPSCYSALVQLAIREDETE